MFTDKNVDRIKLLQKEDSIDIIKEDLEDTFGTNAEITDGIITFRVSTMRDDIIKDRINQSYQYSVTNIMGSEYSCLNPSSIIVHCQDDIVVSVKP